MAIFLNGQQEAFAGIHADAQAITESMGTSLSEPELTRSARNVLIWQSYLPPDCVASMINMGWDHST
jgi:hypothetical protein